MVATVSLCFMLKISFYANVDNKKIKPTLLMPKPKQDFLRKISNIVLWMNECHFALVAITTKDINFKVFEG